MNAAGLALAMAAGALISWSVTDGYYQRKIERTEAAQLKAEEKRNEKIGELATHWQALLDDANSVEPTVITERVLVRASCVQTASADAVADGAATARTELAEGVVRNLERLAQQKEQQYRECSYRLRSLQEAMQ